MGVGGLALVAILALVFIAHRQPEPQPAEKPPGWWVEAALMQPPRKSDPPAPEEARPRVTLAHGRAMQRPTEALHFWDSDDEDGSDPQTFRLGDVTVTFASAASLKDGSGDEGLMIHVSAPGVKTRTVTFTGYESRTTFGVGRVDAVRTGRQLLFNLDSGGRGCCLTYWLLTAEGGRWRLDRLDRWDLGLHEWPKDYNGDGAPELMSSDLQFVRWPLAPFDQWPPPTFTQVRAGKAIDVSRHPGLADEYRAAMREAEPACRQGDNFACAGFVAAATRVGQRDRAWKIMLSSYNKEDDPEKLPWVDCDLPSGREACTADERTYPLALKAFLDQAGYF